MRRRAHHHDKRGEGDYLLFPPGLNGYACVFTAQPVCLDGWQKVMLEYPIILTFPAQPDSSQMDETVHRLIQGDRRILSRLISFIEHEDSRGAEVMARIFHHSGSSYCIGVTGSPGAGKSTLVDSLVKVIRSQDLTVGVIAVDPTSPYSGGAFLGDRIRMQRHFMDPGVYIRSMATRNSAGGLPRMVQGAVKLLDAAGTDIVLVETVGVGQTELGIMDVADTVVVVVMPESGDIIQTLKAGLMETADIYVVNKADLPGADKMVTAIRVMLHMASASDGWLPLALTTQAHLNVGVSELYDGIREHREFQSAGGFLEQRRVERRGREFTKALEAGLMRKLQTGLSENLVLKDALDRVTGGEWEPYSSAQKLLGQDISELLDAPGGPTDTG